MRQIIKLGVAVICAWATPSLGEAPSQSFLPTWRLLNTEQKQEFIAGYLKGFTDAASILEIAQEYVKENPKTALQSLESLKKVYRVPSLSPSELVSRIDTFYSLPENKDKPFSLAFGSAR